MQPTMAGPSGNYTRNLIGSCSVSAYSLSDLNENMGLWFVLQDLSVRTEGSFRYIALLTSNSFQPYPPLTFHPSQAQILLHQRRRAERHTQPGRLARAVDLLLRRLHCLVCQEVSGCQGEHGVE